MSEWNTNTTNKKVVVHKDGRTTEYTYAPTTKLGDAVSKSAQAMNMSTVIVKCDGNEVQPEQSETPVGDFGTIEVFPKFAGAQ